MDLTNFDIYKKLFYESFSIIFAFVVIFLVLPLFLFFWDKFGVSFNKFNLSENQLEVIKFNKIVNTIPYKEIISIKKQFYLLFFFRIMFFFAFEKNSDVYDTTYFYVLKVETKDKEYFFSPRDFNIFHLNLLGV